MVDLVLRQFYRIATITIDYYNLVLDLQVIG